MTCYRIGKGFICTSDNVVNLKPYGANIWMEWHHYMGPTFFRSENRIKPIYYPSKKTWQAFYKWQEEG
jgi:hypothetical protein